ncbi:MAG: ArsR family transcriptional regulator [Candidatus Woesearchaeota archaeon]
MKILITTLYRGDVNPIVMYKIGADKVAFVLDLERVKKDAIDNIKDKFDKLTKIDIIKIQQFDVPKITEEILKYANKNKDAEFIFHASEGRKTMFLGCLYAASMLKAKCYYLREDNSEMYSVPLFNLHLNKTKIDILKALSDGITSKVKLAKHIHKHRSLIYNHLSDLNKGGFIDEKHNLTETGRIVMMG